MIYKSRLLLLRCRRLLGVRPAGLPFTSTPNRSRMVASCSLVSQMWRPNRRCGMRCWRWALASQPSTSLTHSALLPRFRCAVGSRVGTVFAEVPNRPAETNEATTSDLQDKQDQPFQGWRTRSIEFRFTCSRATFDSMSDLERIFES